MTPSSQSRAEGVVCDLDGVLYRGHEPIPGAAAAITSLRERGVRFVFATNNATTTPAQRLQHMRAMGIVAGPEELLTSAVVTAEHLQQRGWSGKAAFVIGKEGICHALTEAGIATLPIEHAGEADLVVVSGDRDFNYDAMKAAALAVRAGAQFIATNDDATFPAPTGSGPALGLSWPASSLPQGKNRS